MDVLIAGGHGQISLRLARLLAGRGDRARGLIRDPRHADDLEAGGAEPVIFDLESDNELDRHARGADAVVFAAGAGPGSGPARKRTVDLGGALKLIEACKAAGVERYLMISAMGVDRGAAFSGPMKPYLDAKLEADEALRDSGLAFTIVRPGRLTDRPGGGRIEVGTPLERRGEVSRDDVAATLAAVLDEPRTSGLTFDVLAGDLEIAEAIAGLAERQPRPR
jgi:uncharacterized protein YbjT (DUF2867 family)